MAGAQGVDQIERVQVLVNHVAGTQALIQVTVAQAVDQVARAQVLDQVAGAQELDQVAGVQVVLDQVARTQAADNC